MPDALRHVIERMCFSIQHIKTTKTCNCCIFPHCRTVGSYRLFLDILTTLKLRDALPAPAIFHIVKIWNAFLVFLFLNGAIFDIEETIIYKSIQTKVGLRFIRWLRIVFLSSRPSCSKVTRGILTQQKNWYKQMRTASSATHQYIPK